MNESLYELKDMLCEELEEYGKKGELTAGSLEIVDKLTHTIKNLDKIIEKMEDDEEYSNYGGSYEGDGYGGMTTNRSMNRGGRSYARGRGRNAKRDSMGRYSSNGYSRTGDLADRLRELAADAPDDRTRTEIHKLVSKMEQM